MLGERDSGWREADRAVDRASRRFGVGSVRPATLLEPPQSGLTAVGGSRPVRRAGTTGRNGQSFLALSGG